MKAEFRQATVGWAGIALGATLVVVALIPARPWGESRSAAPSSASSAPPAPATVATTRIALAPVAAPQRVTIPSISLSASVIPVGLQPDGRLAAPANYSLAGWYAGGTVPGAPGPSVLVGHVDSHLGPAVFFRLHELVPGQSIVIETADHTSFTFVAERIEQHPKDRFPTTAVYGSTTQRALRLITCGGEFDYAAGSYRDNIVIFATLTQ